jgi:hypothetical protein
VSLALRPGTGRVSRSGRVAVRVLCSTAVNRVTVRPGTCRGEVDLFLRRSGARVGTARFSVPGGERRTVRVQLASAALRLVREGRRVRVAARTRGALAGARRVVATTSLTLTATGSR